MAAGDIMLHLLITGSATSALAAVGGLSRSLGSSGLTGALAGVGVAAAAAAIGIGVAAVKAAGDFQAETERLVTSAGELQGNLGLVRQGLLQMSVDTATSTDQLAAGMYFVESAGYHAAAGLEVLKAAAMGAKSENADLDVVAKALTTEMVDYHMSAGQAAEAMNGLIAAVQNGKTNLQDLASSMGAVLPIASSLGISFPQVAGAMDTMTNAGMSSRQAAMNLAHVLLSLSAPSNVAVKAMKEVGLSAQGVKDALVHQGLPEALQMIEDAVGKKFPPGSVAYEQAMKSITGGIMGVKLAAMLTGPSLNATEQNIKHVADAMKNGHGAVMGFAEVQNTLNFRMGQVSQAGHGLLIVLGTTLLPIITNVASHVATAVVNFTHWLTEGNKLQNALNAVGTVIGGVTSVIGGLVSGIANVVNFFRQNQAAALALLVPLGMLSAVLVQMAVGAIVSFLASIPELIIGFSSWAVSATGAAIATLAATWPLLAIGAAIGAVIAIIVLLVTHWQQVTSFLTGVWNKIKQVAMTVWGAITSFFTTVWNAVKGPFIAVWNVIWSILSTIWNVIKMAAFVIFSIIVAIIILPFLPLINWFKAHWTQILAVLQAVWNVISSVATTVWNAITGFITTVVDKAKIIITVTWSAIKNVLSSVWNTIKSVASSVWNAITGAIQGPVNTVKGWLSSAWDTIKKAFSDAMGALSGIAQSAWDGVSSTIKKAIDGLISIINHMIDGVNSVTGAIGIPAIPHIPMLAGGGMNLPAGMYWVGEMGPEILYIPQGAGVLSNQQSTALVSRAGSYAVAGSRGGGGALPPIQPAAVYLDKREIGQILFSWGADSIRRQAGLRSR